MKTMSKVLTAAFVLLFANNSFAQSADSDNGTATATIIAPITIEAKRALQFGNIAIHASTAGTVTIPLTGARTFDGGVTLPNGTGTVTTAKFDVTGDADRTFLVTLPASAELAHASIVGQKMIVDAFKCTYGETRIGTLSATGTATFDVAATLKVNGGQAAGNYSGTFPVIVDYN